MLTLLLLALSAQRPNEHRDFSTSAQIQAHLERTEAELRQVDSSVQNRRELLDRLHEYRLRGRFPHNDGYSGQSPVFIDEHGTACAVGQLIIDSGHGELARTVSQVFAGAAMKLVTRWPGTS